MEPKGDVWSNIKSEISPNSGINPDTSTLGSNGIASGNISWLSTIIVGSIITATIVVGYFYFENKTDEKKLESISEKVETSSQDNQKEVLEKPIQENNELVSAEEARLKKSLPENHSEEEMNAKANQDKPIINTSVIDDDSNAHDFNASAEKINEDESEVNNPIDELSGESNSTATTENVDNEVLSKNSTRIEDNTDKSETKETTLNSSENSESIEKVKNPEDLIFERLNAYQLPNIFTPNQDGKNDYFEIDIEEVVIDAIEVAIFDITGNLIKSWKTLYGKWDGTLADGNPAPTGLYLYQIILKKEGVLVPRKGFITLNR